MLAIAAVTVLVIRAVTENQVFFRIAVPSLSTWVEPESTDEGAGVSVA